MTSKSPVRSCDDVDEQVLSYAEVKALCAGNPLIRQKMDLDVDVARLKVLKADHQSKQYRLEDQLLKEFPADIERNKGYLAGFQKDREVLEAHPLPQDAFVGMEVRGTRLTEKAAAGEALLACCQDYSGKNEKTVIGEYRGFSMELKYDSFEKAFQLTLRGAMSHSVTLGTDARGNITRLDNCLAAMPERMQNVQNTLEHLYQQQAAAQEEVGKPFPQEAELQEKSARLAELDAVLNMEERESSVPSRDEVIERETGDRPGKRPSVLAQLRETTGKGSGRPSPVRSVEVAL